LFFLLPNTAYAEGDISNWLYNIATQVPVLVRLTVAIAYFSGFAFFIKAILKFKNCARGISMASQSESVSGPIIYLVVAAVLLYFASFVQVGSVTLFGDDSAIAYNSSAGSDAFSTGVLGPIIVILRLIGYIAFLKGFYILSSLGSGQAQKGTLGKGVVHVLGGILAINIEATYLVLLHTLVGSSGIG
jgi:intracellular multiplication protein IcmC